MVSESLLLVALILIAHILTVIIAVGRVMIFMLAAGSLSLDNARVEELELVARVIIKRFVDHLAHRKDVLNGLRGHAHTTEDVTCAHVRLQQLPILVEEDRGQVFIHHVFDAFGGDGPEELCLWVLRAYFVQNFVYQLTFYD